MALRSRRARPAPSRTRWKAAPSRQGISSTRRMSGLLTLLNLLGSSRTMTHPADADCCRTCRDMNPGPESTQRPASSALRGSSSPGPGLGSAKSNPEIAQTTGSTRATGQTGDPSAPIPVTDLARLLRDTLPYLSGNPEVPCSLSSCRPPTLLRRFRSRTGSMPGCSSTPVGIVWLPHFKRSPDTQLASIPPSAR